MNVRKTLLVTLLMSGMSVLCGAQSKGDIMVSGSISISSSSEKDKVTGDEAFAVDKNKVGGEGEFSIVPKVHYFISDNIAVGAGIGYMGNREFTGYGDPAKFESPLYDSYGAFYFEPSAYYYLKICNKFYYTPEVYIGIAAGKYKEEVYKNDAVEVEPGVKTTMLGIGVRLAQFEYRFTDCFRLGLGFEFADLSYISAKSKDMFNDDKNTSVYTSNRFNFGVNNFESADNLMEVFGSISLTAKFVF